MAGEQLPLSAHMFSVYAGSPENARSSERIIFRNKENFELSSMGGSGYDPVPPKKRK